jgi:hypothetical protein
VRLPVFPQKLQRLIAERALALALAFFASLEQIPNHNQLLPSGSLKEA